MTEEKKMAEVTISYASDRQSGPLTDALDKSECQRLTRPGVIATVGAYQSVDGGEVTK